MDNPIHRYFPETERAQSIVPSKRNKFLASCSTDRLISSELKFFLRNTQWLENRVDNRVSFIQSPPPGWMEEGQNSVPSRFLGLKRTRQQAAGSALAVSVYFAAVHTGLSL
jgi:hypothetical protein